MTYVIAEPCIDIKDRSCIDVCPVDCIHETDRMLVIDPEECIDCGACEPECPVEAIFPEDALPQNWQPFVRINAKHADGAAAVDQLVDAFEALMGTATERAARPSTALTRVERSQTDRP